MNHPKRTRRTSTLVFLATLLSMAVAITACGDDDDKKKKTGGGNDTGVTSDTGGTTDTGTTDTGADDTGTPDTGPADTGTPDTGTPDTGAKDTGTKDTGTTDTGGGDTDMDTSGGNGDADTGVMGFNFRKGAPSQFEQIDRMGMPAVSTALAGKKKDAYNKGTPTDDAKNTFVPTVVQNLTAIHGWFDGDLKKLGLTPCSMKDMNKDNLPDCLGQKVVKGGPSVASLVVPDTLTLNTSAKPGFPNGRALADPVMDVTLAVILLDMTKHAPTTFAKLPLNPPKNDANNGNFPSSFPYLNPPHSP